jgi:hypothetical protein
MYGKCKVFHEKQESEEIHFLMRSLRVYLLKWLWCLFIPDVNVLP